MAIIWPCPLTPSSYALAGCAALVPSQACPVCQRPLTGWGGYWRWVRSEHRSEQQIWVRRGWCGFCRRTEAFLPSFLLVRRLDADTVIGSALEEAAAGSGMRPIARRLELPHTTVRDWWRRVKTKAPTLLTSLLAFATSLDPAPVPLGTDGAAAVLEALGHAWQRARQRWGPRVPDRWGFWSLISGGLALAPHTRPP